MPHQLAAAAPRRHLCASRLPRWLPPSRSRALLEADVSLPVVRRFVKKVEEAALGERVVKGLSPDQKLVKVGANSQPVSFC